MSLKVLALHLVKTLAIFAFSMSIKHCVHYITSIFEGIQKPSQYDKYVMEGYVFNIPDGFW